MLGMLLVLRILNFEGGCSHRQPHAEMRSKRTMRTKRPLTRKRVRVLIAVLVHPFGMCNQVQFAKVLLLVVIKYKSIFRQTMTLRLLVSILALTSFMDQSQVVAFAISPRSSPLSSSIQTTVPTTTRTNIMGTNPQENILRGGATPTKTALKTATTVTAVSAPKPEKKLRLLALDGLRFLLCTYIVLGHFFRFANPPAFLLKFFAQINITVGAFFALSGYVSAYTTTEVGERKASPKLTSIPSQKWWLSKCMGYYPMHWLVLLLFSPMFLYSDVSVLGWPKAILHGIMSVTLTQAWFPMHAEVVWNAPSWYLSSLTFSTAVLPFSLPKIAGMDKQGLRRTAAWLFLVKLLPVLGYLYDHNTWSLVEGMTITKLHPALAVFNAQRFYPVFNTAEILMGVVACRLVMLDTLDNKDKPIKTTWLSTAVPLTGLVGTLAIRAAGLVPDCSDLLIRCFLVPVFLKFVMGTHRNAVAKVKDPVSSFLSSKAMVWLGGLSFPIYIVHGEFIILFDSV
jgi:peptidoglycan/LPS O-acetylase OafA/YrhL